MFNYTLRGYKSGPSLNDRRLWRQVAAGMDALREALPSWAWSPSLLLYTSKEVIVRLQLGSRRLQHVSENCKGGLHIDNGNGKRPVAIVNV